MKNVLLIMFALLLITACSNNGQKNTTNKIEEINASQQDANTVYVYYFHGKQRCMTCNTVENIAKETVKKNYASNSNVIFLALPNYEKTNEVLAEKYEISWNGLIIAKGDNSINITEQAFAHAVNNPDILEELIKNEVESRLN